MKTISLILARGGSKGIPLKNTRTVGSISLIERSVRAGLGAKLPVYLSTDHAEIEEITRQAGGMVIKRPKELAQDDSSSESAIVHALSLPGLDADIVVFMQPTSPFIDPNSILAAIDKVRCGAADSVFSAVEDHTFRWQQSADGHWEPISHSKLKRPRRQDLVAQVRETGAFYVFSKAKFMDEETRFCGKSTPQFVDPRFSLEIDSFEDLELANILAPAWDKAQRMALGTRDLNSKLGWIKAVAYDFDGVLTPNTVIVNEEGLESVAVSRGDGFGVGMLKKLGIFQAIISLESNKVVQARGSKLGIETFNGVEDKLSAVRIWAASISVSLDQIAFIGNDLNDLEVMQHVGLSVAVADAEPEVLGAADLVLRSSGGSGAIREFARLMTQNRN